MPTIDDYQLNLNRRPLVEIISSNFQDDIPFDGQLLTTNEENEKHPASIMHSSGRMMVVYTKAPVNADLQNAELHFRYTDVDRNEFQTVVTWETLASLTTVEAVTLVEMLNGNVAVHWIEYGGGKYYRKYRIVTEVGVLVTQGEINNWTTALGNYGGTHIIRLA